MTNVYTAHWQSPMGLLRIAATDDAITEVVFADAPTPSQDQDHPLIAECIRQLDEYFAGNRTAFELPISPKGTEFERRMWRALCSIPHGTTVSYAQLAQRIDSPKAFRAVGSACGKNPIIIIIPCHRVLGSDGGIGGFSCGLFRKRALLALEGVQIRETVLA